MSDRKAHILASTQTWKGLFFYMVCATIVEVTLDGVLEVRVVSHCAELNQYPQYE